VGILFSKAGKREPRKEGIGTKCVHVSVVYFYVDVGKSKKKNLTLLPM